MPLDQQQQEMYGEFVKGLERQYSPAPLVEAASQRNPDTMAESIRLEKETGLPAEIIAEDLPAHQQAERLRNLRLDRLPERSPVVSQWLKDPENAAVSHDDIEILERIEDHYRKSPTKMGSWYEGWGSSLGKSVQQAWYGGKAMLAAGEMERTDLGPDRPEYGFVKEDFLAEQKAKYDEAMARYKELGKDIQDLTPGGMSWWQESLRSGTQSAARVGALLIPSLLTKGKFNPVLPGLTAEVFGSSYGKAASEGKTHSESLNYAQGQAAVELLTEIGPAKLLGDISKDLGTRPIGEKLKRWFLQDFAGEQAATGMQTVIDVVNDLDEEIAKAETATDVFMLQAYRQLVTAGSTVVGSGTIAGGLKALDYAAGGPQARSNRAALKAAGRRMDSAAGQDWLDGFMELAQSSKTNERAAENFQSFIDSMPEDARVFLSADIAAELEGAPDYVIEQLDGTGADVTMSMSQFINDFMSDQERLAFVRPHIKVRDDLQTLSEMEADVDSASVARLVERAKANKAAIDESDRIYAEVKDQLVATGRLSESTARIQAEIIPAYIVAKQAEYKAAGVDLSIQQLYDDMVLRIVGPKAEVKADEDTTELESGTAPKGFSWASGMELYDNYFTSPAGKEYFHEWKGYQVEQEVMTPDEYIKAVAEGFGKSERDLISQRQGGVTEEYAEAMKRGDVFPALTLDYVKGGFTQEGLHRAIAAKAAGLDAVPVLVRRDYTSLAQDGLDFADKTYTKKVGNKSVTVKAQDMWDNIQQRFEMVEALRKCLKTS